jgi:hypothetical protein
MSDKSEWNASFRISVLLQEANLLAACYKKYMVEASDEEIEQHLKDPDKARIMLHLVDLLK